VIASYFFAVANERRKVIDNLTQTIENQKQELREWQNKHLSTPLGFETLSRKPKAEPSEKNWTPSPVPKTPTRAELNKRRKENGVFQQTAVNSPLQDRALDILGNPQSNE
jgi:hypothetical protein